MKIKRNAIAAAVAGAIGLSGAMGAAEAASLTSLVITGGTFAMGVFTPAPNPITNFSGANLIAGAIAPTFDTSVAQTGADASSPVAWDFNLGGTWVNSYTTGASSGDATGTSISGTINLTDNWNGTNFAQGGAFSGTASGGTSGTFSASWTSLISGGPFNGQTGTYNVDWNVCSTSRTGSCCCLADGLRPGWSGRRGSSPEESGSLSLLKPY